MATTFFSTPFAVLRLFEVLLPRRSQFTSLCLFPFSPGFGIVNRRLRTPPSTCKKWRRLLLQQLISPFPFVSCSGFPPLFPLFFNVRPPSSRLWAGFPKFFCPPPNGPRLLFQLVLEHLFFLFSTPFSNTVPLFPPRLPPMVGCH